MADMIPEYMPDSATQGERRVFAALQALPDDVVVYYEPVIQRRYPDFIVLAPEVGVIVVEVKGLRLKSSTHVDAHSITRYARHLRAPLIPICIREKTQHLHKHQLSG